MKRKSTILLISGAAISTLLRLSATEGGEHGNETPQEIANEILTGQPAHSEQNEKISILIVRVIQQGLQENHIQRVKKHQRKEQLKANNESCYLHTTL